VWQRGSQEIGRRPSPNPQVLKVAIDSKNSSGREKKTLSRKMSGRGRGRSRRKKLQRKSVIGKETEGKESVRGFERGSAKEETLGEDHGEDKPGRGELLSKGEGRTPAGRTLTQKR